MHERGSPHARSHERLLHHVRLLQIHRRRRSTSQQFVLEGIRQFVHACDAGFAFDTIVHCPILLRHQLAQRLVRQLSSRGVRRVTVTPEAFRAVSTAEHASGICAIVKQRWTSLNETDSGCGLGWLVFDRLRSPGNLGTILRTAEAVGMSGAIFVGADACDPYDPLVVRASMGGIFHLPLLRASARQLGIWLAQRDITAVALTPHTARLWSDLPPARSYAILLGEERQGLSPPLRRLSDCEVRLPMTGRADSLNVGVAAGAMMYELVRRSALK